MSRIILIAVAVATLTIAACTEPPPTTDNTAAATDTQRVAVVAEVFQTERDTLDNIDSPAVWHGPNGEHWVLTTAKLTDVVVVTDAVTGALVRRVGGTGMEPGEMDRPNGIAVIEDMMFVVERDNRRVQVFTLPEFRSIGIFGREDLGLPYGIAIHRTAPGSYDAYITDNYELTEDVIPPDSMLGRRIRQYRVTVADGAARAELRRTFGDTSGPGVLRVVESIAIDPANNRLLIAEEQEGASMIKVYDLEGTFTGDVLPSQYFPHQAEGIVLYECGDSAGYWITTDQGLEVNTFHVFDRMTLAHVGSFRGPTVLNTDGIALTQRNFASFPTGAFYAVHNDGNLVGFSWGSVAEAIGARSDCTLTAPGVRAE